MAAASQRIDTFLLGYTDATRALLAHLDAEAPWRLRTVCVLDPDPLVARAAGCRDVRAAATDLWDPNALRAAGLAEATTIVAFAERINGSVHQLERLVRAVAPSARFLVVPAGSCASPDGLITRVASPLRLVTSWRFWALVGIAIVDGLIFVVPVTALALVTSALVNPQWLRTAARFVNDLAEAR